MNEQEDPYAKYHEARRRYEIAEREFKEAWERYEARRANAEQPTFAERLAQLAEQFPTLEGADGLHPFDAGALAAWAANPFIR